MTPYEVADAVLAVADDALADSPDRQFVAAGRTVAVMPGCEQLVVRVGAVVSSSDAASNSGGRALCVGFNRVDLCIELARCHPTPEKAGSTVSAADLDASFSSILADGHALYMALDGPMWEDTLGDCSVVGQTTMTFDNPRGGMVSVSVCITVAFTPSALGS